MTDTITNNTRGLTAGAAGKPNEVRDLTFVELDAVSGGCPCRPTNCDCDKPSPRIP
jgi:hypothetical protein